MKRLFPSIPCRIQFIDNRFEIETARVDSLINQVWFTIIQETKTPASQAEAQATQASGIPLTNRPNSVMH